MRGKKERKSKNRSIITNPAASYETLLSRYLPFNKTPFAYEYGRTPALAKRSFLASSYAYETQPPWGAVAPKFDAGGTLLNTTDYLNSLKTNARLDRDFTIWGRRFRALGSPFDLDENGAFFLASGIQSRIKDNENIESITLLVNLYHIVVGLYLAFLNRSYEFLDILKSIQSSLAEGNSFQAKLIHTQVVTLLKELQEKLENIGAETELGLLYFAFGKNSPTIDNLEWGDGSPPLEIETLYTKTWEDLIAKVQEQKPVMSGQMQQSVMRNGPTKAAFFNFNSIVGGEPFKLSTLGKKASTKSVGGSQRSIPITRPVEKEIERDKEGFI